MRFLKSIPLLPVKNIEEAVEFYQINLGFDCINQNSKFAKMKANEVELFLCCMYVEYRATGCCIQVSDMTSLYDAYQITGAYNNNENIDFLLCKNNGFSIRDPWGNLIHFYEQD